MENQLKIKSVKMWGCLLVIAALIGIMPACGKKAPPVAPRQVPLPVVKDLSADVEGNTLLLSWSVTETRNVERFLVFRSMMPTAEAGCEKCPLLFTEVAEIETGTDQSDQRQLQYTERLESGMTYAYKVVAYGRGKHRGEDSNLVQFKR